MVTVRTTNVGSNATNINGIAKQSKIPLYLARVKVCVSPSIIFQIISTSTQGIVMVNICGRILFATEKSSVVLLWNILPYVTVSSKSLKTDINMIYLPIQESWFYHHHPYDNCMNISKIDKQFDGFPATHKESWFSLNSVISEKFLIVIKIIRNWIYNYDRVECAWRIIISFYLKPFLFVFIGLHLPAVFPCMPIWITIFTVGFLSRIISTISHSTSDLSPELFLDFL